MAQKKQFSRKILAGCGVIILLGITAVILMAALLFEADRQAAQYPDSEPITNHENYSGLPFTYKWDNAYRSYDPFPAVYNWYSTGFDLGPEMRGNGRCILMQGSQTRLATTRHMSVLLCDTPTGNMIYVSRSTTFR